LAGSERQKQTGTIGNNLKEASNINKSLSILGSVINSLVEESEGKKTFVRYRDSKLTFILKDSLGGNSKTCLIANVSPAASSYQETLSTIKFAQRAKQIKNKASINEDSSGSLDGLKKEINRLREELVHAKSLIGNLETEQKRIPKSPKLTPQIMSINGKMSIDAHLIEHNHRYLDLEVALQKSVEVLIQN
jgi:hypothetical protein